MHNHTWEFHFCPVCGAKLGQTVLKNHEPPRLVCTSCDFVFYLDPKVVACTIVELNERIILLKRGIDPEKGKWVIPGGYVDRGEEVEAAAIRETEEECGLKVRIRELLGVYSYVGSIPIVIVFTAHPISGKLSAADETLEAELFPPNRIPWKELAFRSTWDALKDHCENRIREGALKNHEAETREN
jgi:ADP-ribose pyrophosphatase YjhB (NUDIX family)